jgi:hypothetical protein
LCKRRANAKRERARSSDVAEITQKTEAMEKTKFFRVIEVVIPMRSPEKDSETFPVTRIEEWRQSTNTRKRGMKQIKVHSQA